MSNFRADEEERRAFEAEILPSNSTIQAEDLDKFRKQNISIYAGLVVGTFILAYASAGAFLFIAVSASQNLHNNMFRKLLGAKIYFFDTNPVGKCFLKCWMINNVCTFFSVILVI
mgnify:CR=1 FL=1